MADPAVTAALDAAGVAYEVLPCDPDLADTEAFCRAYGVAPEESANTIVVATREDVPRYVACVLLATCRLDVNGAVRRRLGVRKVSFASPERTAALTGMVSGGVTPLGLPPDVPVWVDARVLDAAEIVLGAGTRTAKIRVSPKVFSALDHATVIEGLAVERRD